MMTNKQSTLPVGVRTLTTVEPEVHRIAVYYLHSLAILKINQPVIIISLDNVSIPSTPSLHPHPAPLPHS